MTGKELRIACAILNKSYAGLARSLRLHPKTIGNYVNGNTPIPYATALAIQGMVDNAERGADSANREFFE